jgi:hypothetical protein
VRDRYYDQKKRSSSRLSGRFAIVITTRKKGTVIWPSLVAPFQLPLLRRSNYDRNKGYSHLFVVLA